VGIGLSPSGINNTTDSNKGGYRIGSYGFNGNLHGADRKPPTGSSSESHFGRKFTAVKPATEVPVFYDAIWIDNIAMENGTAGGQPQPPTDLQGTQAPSGSNNND